MREQSPALVVGIGASAGGLEALQEFFDHVEDTSEIAFVVVQHLSPDFKSLMDELLERHTHMPVQVVEERMALQANNVYLIPPGKEMIVSDGVFLLKDKERSSSPSLPVDLFFKALAEEYRDRAVGIILSGTGSDGSRGIVNIKDSGGWTLVQQPDTARFDGMPLAAISSEAVDIILSSRKMPKALMTHFQWLKTRPRPQASGDDSRIQIFEALRNRFRVDFSEYKDSTFDRRVERRREQLQLETLDDYADRLVSDPKELETLYHDLLIGVTGFFRDDAAFGALSSLALPELVNRMSESSPLRLWTPGCATGEEAYSLAMALVEEAEHQDTALHAKIFATDIHDRSIEFAGRGIYDETAMENVSPERRSRFFEATEEGWRVSPSIRRLVVFAQQNVLHDPPFTRIDLVTCRNLLIYLRPDTQRRLLSLFLFALRTRGFLLLGKSEGIATHEGDFEPLDAQQRLYRKEQSHRAGTMTWQTPRFNLPAERHQTRFSGHGSRQQGRLLEAYDHLLTAYAPPGLLISAEGEVLHIFGDASRWLQPLQGRLVTNIRDMIVPGLRAPLATAMQRVLGEKDSRNLTMRELTVAVDGEERHVRLGVERLGEEEISLLVTLEQEAGAEGVPAQTKEDIEVAFDAEEVSSKRIQYLEEQLRYSRESLQTTVEELETSNEELQASNEELMAANEELQSTNEELHSVNEELYTVNSEYQAKIDELNHLTADLNNLIKASDVGTIFLDRDLNIRKFTPAIRASLNLLDHDIGRPLHHITSRLINVDLSEVIEEVIDSGKAVTREFSTTDDAWQLVGISPYRDSRDRIDGAVVTFTDITRIKRTQRELAESWHFLQAVMDSFHSEVVVIDDVGEIKMVNRAWVRFSVENDLQVDANYWVGRNYLEVCQDIRYETDSGEMIHLHEAFTDLLQGGRESFVVEYPCHGPKVHRWYRMSAIPFAYKGRRWVVIAHDNITKRVIAEDSRRQIEERLQQAQKLESLGVLAGGIAHDFNNILTAISGNAGLLQAKTRMQPDLMEDVDNILIATRRGAELVREILAYTGRSQVISEVIDLSEMVVEMRSLLNSSIGKSIEVRLNLKENLPPILGDPTQIRQIVMNLITNASDAYGKEAGTIDISTDLEYCDSAFIEAHALPEVVQSGHFIHLLVEDHGCGIPESVQRKIFEPFFSTKFTGRGLGLAAVLGIMQAHHGFMFVESTDGVGTKMHVYFPQAPADAKVTPRPEPAKTRHDHRSSDAIEGTILVVDDEPEVLRVNCTILERSGLRVLKAADGFEAIDVFTEHVDTVDVVLLDLTMPRMDGFRCLEKLREIRPRVTVIVTSGYTEADVSQRLSAYEGVSFLQKPFSVKQLVSAVRAVFM